MKIFLDTANVAAIKKWSVTGLIDGVTTNPTHLSKEGGDPKKVVLQICKLLPEGHISVEVTNLDPEKVYEQAKAISKLAKNIWVKVPCHANYYETIKRLVDEEVKLNITLVFTVLQTLMMCKLGVYYISPFVGRWDDIDVDGMAFVPQMREMIDFYGYESKILAASIRGVQNFHEAVMAGADAVTVPVEVFEKSLANPLTDAGIAKFTNDWKKLGIKQFP
jgi:transaldolase